MTLAPARGQAQAAACSSSTPTACRRPSRCSRTRAEPLGIDLVVEPVTAEAIAWPGGDLFGVLLQYPGASGRVRDPAPLVEAAHAAGRAGRRRRRPARADPAHAARRDRAPTSPSAPPSASACRWASAARTPATSRSATALERQLPGRLVGVSVDADGAPGLPARAADPRAAHPPREGDQQHLHRAGAAGRDGRRCTPSTTARTGWRRSPGACTGSAAVAGRGAARRRASRSSTGDFFDTVRSRVPGGRDEVVAAGARARGINLCLVDADDACRSPATRPPPTTQLRGRVAAFGVVADAADVELSGRTARCRPRCGAPPTYLTHPVFSAHRSETAMLRYLRRLADSDFALDRSMIPLGSCTMKLNATTEMEPISWPEFAGLHPFAPAAQAGGYLELIESARAPAGRDHRLRRGLGAAERRLAGRAGRPARDPRLPPPRAATRSATSA